jgi:hypothetical protein
MTENKTMTDERFPDCNHRTMVYKNKAHTMMSGFYGLCTDKKYRSVPVAMAGQIRGAINAGLDLFGTFWGNAKKYIKKTQNFIRTQFN